MVCAGPGNRFVWLLVAAAREMQALDGDALWRDELARAKHWLAARAARREKRQRATLARVNAHVHFAHAQQHERAQEADSDEGNVGQDGGIDLPLDFLGPVDAEDVRSLLEAEAARAAAAVTETPVIDLQQEKAQQEHLVEREEEKPLEMPSHLLTKNSPPKLYASIAKSAHLQPKFVVPPVRLPAQATKKVPVTALASVALEEDAGVAELMNELELDLSDVDHHLPSAAHASSKQDNDEEQKSEEFVGEPAGGASSQRASAMDDLARSVFRTTSVLAKKGRNVIRDGSDESDDDAKPTAAPPGVSVDPDVVADEMRGWVTGYRDPEVLRRKEAMARRARRPTARFGVSSAEEQRSINRAAKFYAGEDGDASSDSESEDSSGSDFSPVEAAEERDDPASEVELLSDDYLEEEQAGVSHAKNPQRRRLRNKHKDSKAAKTRQTKAKTASKIVAGAGSTSGEARTSPPKANYTTAGAASQRSSNGSSERTEKSRPGAEPSVRHHPNSPESDQEHETIDLLSSDEGTASTTPKKTDANNSKSAADSSRPGLSRLPLLTKPVAQKQESPSVINESQRTLQSTTVVEKEPKVVHLKDGAKPSLHEKLNSADTSRANQVVQTQPATDVANLDLATQTTRLDGVSKTNVAIDSLPSAESESSAKEGGSDKSGDSSRQRSEADGKAASVREPGALTEASLKEHAARESSNATKPASRGASAETYDDVSEADTLDFNDIEEMSDEPIYEFKNTSTRQEDLGFSDDDHDDDGDDADGPAVVAPNDDEYEQFFADTPLRKQKLKEQQERKAAETKGAELGKHKKVPANETKTPTATLPGSTAKSNNGTTPASTPAAAIVAPVVPETTGSNGLRKRTKPGTIATTTVMKGKYQLSRRSMKVIVEENPGKGKRSVAGVYGNSANAMIGVKKSRFSEPLVQGPHVSTEFTADFLSSISDPSLDRGYQRNKAEMKPKNSEEEGRYLLYGNKKPNGEKAGQDKDSDDEPLSASVRGTKVADALPKQAVSSKGWSFSSAVASNENVDSNPVAKAPEFPRDRQIDIYDALHIEGRAENGLTLHDLRDGEFKRPSAFKKVQEEREKRGISFIPRETYLENLPIPKKKMLPGQQQQTSAKTSPAKPSSESRGSSDNSKRSCTGKPSHTDKPSHYGPSSSSGVEALSSKNKSVYSSNDKSYNGSKGKRGKYDKFNARRSYSPPSRRRSDDIDSHRFSSGGRGKGSQRRYGRSRSPSPRPKDRYSSNSDASRKRHRSTSRSRSRERDDRGGWSRKGDDRDRSRSSKDKRDDRDSRRDTSPLTITTDRGPSENSRKRARSIESADGKSWTPQIDDRSDPPKRAKPLDPRTCVSADSPPPPGALFEEGFESDMFISDSDNENENAEKAATDIRFDLENVQVDARLLKRRVYVTGMTAMMSEDELEELFAPFGVETDRETGFPAIDVFLCQRSHRPRGDACVTFSREEGALSAVEELNAKIVKNCKIDVRVMTLPLQRLLNAQFHMPRESWKCAASACRADVSIWNNKCDKCYRRRIFGPSRVQVADTDWLCSICFTANADRGVACTTCNASLPPTDRTQFYSK